MENGSYQEETKVGFMEKGFYVRGGRLVLIKSILSSLPTYFMSVYKIQVGVARSMEKLQREFFWNAALSRKRFILWTGIRFV